MANYVDDYKYHEDNVKKNSITKKDLDFLIGLQKEMNTQDENSQADPRFWVIRQKERRYRVEEPDGYELICDSESVAEGMEGLLKYVKDNIIPSLNEEYSGQYEYKLHEETNDEYACIYKKFLGDESETEEVEEESEDYTLTDEGDIIDFIEEHKNVVGEYELVSYKNVDVNIPDTMFLTHKESESHLRRNAHNYNADAHSYSMTAYRSPEVAELYKIIQTVDWDKLKKILESEKDN